MDYFSLFLDCLSLIGQGVMHILFVSRLTGKKQKLRHFALYCLMIAAIHGLSLHFALNGMLAVGAGVLALYGVSRFVLGNQQPISWLASVLAFYVSQLSFGIINSLQDAFFLKLIGGPLLYPLLLVAQILFFVLCAGCYRMVRRFLKWTEDDQTPYIGLLLFPILFFFAAELYIRQSAYGLRCLLSVHLIQ